MFFHISPLIYIYISHISAYLSYFSIPSSLLFFSPHVLTGKLPNPIHFLLISFVSFFFSSCLSFIFSLWGMKTSAPLSYSYSRGHVTLLLSFSFIITTFIFFLKFSLASSFLTLPFFLFFLDWNIWFLYHQAISAPYLHVDCFCPSIQFITWSFFHST